ncbi:UNVERIFIED_ORG: hypothetical protein B2H98_00740 [Clostridium botulinum]
MHTKLKNLIKNTKQIFSQEILDTLAIKSGFIKRKSGKIDGSTFLAFNVFLSGDLCSKSLSTLCARLASNYGISISPQALNERFNSNAVDFMQSVFATMLFNQNQTLREQKDNLTFKRIILNDSTAYSLPDKFYNEFKGSGGSSSASAIKIQLQYDLLSGNFLCCDLYSGTINDSCYLDEMDKQTLPGDLRLADLGYYKIDYLKKIDSKNAFYISKLKITTALYVKNSDVKRKKDGSILKSTEYTKIDILEIIKPLADGEIIELKDIYIGSKKELKNRLIITKLSEESKKTRVKKQLKAVRPTRGKINDRNTAWTGVNTYITNIPENIVSTNKVHDIYSLRWQIEIMFKVWKSIFGIDNVKNVKIERFKCFLYGRLIALLLSSQIVFTAKDIISEETLKEISVLKSFRIFTEYFSSLKTDIFNNNLKIISIFKDIILSIRRFGMKSKRKGKISVKQILNLLKIDKNNFKKLVI